MNIALAFGLFLSGAGLGALLTWLQQTAVRRQFQQELETQIEQALFGGLRRRRLINIRGRPSSGPTRCSAPPEAIATGDGSRSRQPRRESVVLSDSNLLKTFLSTSSFRHTPPYVGSRQELGPKTFAPNGAWKCGDRFVLTTFPHPGNWRTTPLPRFSQKRTVLVSHSMHICL